MNKKFIIIGGAVVLVLVLVLMYFDNSQSISPLTEANRLVQGNPDAKITLVEFSDFECPYCGDAYREMKKILEKYKNDLRFEFRQYPLPSHPDAYAAAEASECANDQGKFWEYYDLLFSNQDKLTSNYLLGYAQSLALDMAKFNQCLSSHAKRTVIAQDIQAGNNLNIKGTPTFFLDGEEVPDWHNLDQLIGDKLKNIK